MIDLLTSPLMIAVLIPTIALLIAHYIAHRQ